MPNVKIDVTISGKWKLDGQKIKWLLRRAVWTGVGAGGFWLVVHWQGPPAPDTRPPVDAPVCWTAGPTAPDAIGPGWSNQGL